MKSDSVTKGRSASSPVSSVAPQSPGELPHRLRCPSIWSVPWFLSRTVRQATQMCKHVRKLVNSQRDLLAPKSINAIAEAMASVYQSIKTGASKPKLVAAMENLEQVANKWLKPYPNAGMRENIEVLLVALAVAMGIRTFFLQPFKIPTGSMQPTLFGITQENLIGNTNYHIPNFLTRFCQYLDQWSQFCPCCRARRRRIASR